MKYLALNLPGGKSVSPPPNFNPQLTDFGSIISAVLNVAILIAAVLTFFWMLWGAFQYIYAGGDKENLSKAKSRITLALVGFIIVLIAFTLSQFARKIIPFNEQQPITTVDVPPTPTPRP